MELKGPTMNQSETITLNNFSNSIWVYEMLFKRNTSEILFLYIEVPFITLIAIIGIFGNLANLYLLWKKKKQSSFKVLLIGLAFFDLLMCLIVIFLWSVPIALTRYRFGSAYIEFDCNLIFHTTGVIVGPGEYH